MKIGFFFLCKPNMMRSQVFSEQDVSRDIVGCLWVVVDWSLSLNGYTVFSLGQDTEPSNIDSLANIMTMLIELMDGLEENSYAERENRRRSRFLKLRPAV